MMAAAAMTILAVVLGTSLPSILQPLGLDSAPGFAVYAIPFAITTVAAAVGRRR
jgi:hypothetical protein